MRVLAIAILMLGLSGCGVPGGGGPEQVELEGTITAVMAGSGDGGYLLDVRDQRLLPLELPDGRPPLNATGVVVEVPDGVAIPDDAAGQFEVLAEWVAETGESLVVVDFLTP